MNSTNVIMTGGTSGFGLVTAKKMIQANNVNLIMGYRSKGVKDAVNLPLELTSLLSVNSFAEEVVKRLGKDKIDALIFNAGINYPSINTLTEDGIEINFGVNHLAHFYLLRLLMPHLSGNAKIIITTSGTIDPATNTFGSPPKHANALWMAYPEMDETLEEDDKINGQRAYASSKLCNLLTAIQIKELPESKQNNWEGIAYDPGVTPGTGLVRYSDEAMKMLSQQLTDPKTRKEKFPLANSIEDAGNTLADIALGYIEPPQDRYVALRGGKITFMNPPGLAQNNETIKKVWQDTAFILKDKLGVIF
ncbi:SDR family NAD(P)-dependent oxidoreductase [Maribellus comscasis]|uniref:SDR family NAD(P)-dependent oxidoreductase n=1 Tax=Maribellus comscasis TaxID=2681766 RepID=A0A6I6JK85_9BACT|nr:SDR family NAD(P)-dependent oxidoreductase [Maribellus comscasis]QGY42711.1 SDR family NAD(P)-dependent oxidoreductase [Maribellus comscasis]